MSADHPASCVTEPYDNSVTQSPLILLPFKGLVTLGIVNAPSREHAPADECMIRWHAGDFGSRNTYVWRFWLRSDHSARADAAAILAVAVVASIDGAETTPDEVNPFQSIEIPPDAFYSGRADYPYRSPFAAVRWEEKTPFVLVDEKWYEYISIDGV